MSDTQNVQTPIDQILDQGRGEQAPQVEPQQHAQPSNDTDPPSDDSADGLDFPADQPLDRRAYDGIKSALIAERAHKKAFAARNRELENEVAELRAAAPDREAQQQRQFWDAPDEHLAALQINSNWRASRAEYIAEHGKARFNELESAVKGAMQAGHPDMPILAARMREAAYFGEDPTAVVETWAEQRGLLGEQDNSGVARTLARGPTFPTALESVRNVGHRRGPEWTGPTSLQDIFDRRKPA